MGVGREEQWAEPGLWASPSCLSVCLSCHDGHLSSPQSVWEVFIPLGERGGGEVREEERQRKGERDTEGEQNEEKVDGE